MVATLRHTETLGTTRRISARLDHAANTPGSFAELGLHPLSKAVTSTSEGHQRRP